MWMLIILAIHVNDPEDIPGRIHLTFQTQQECETVKSTLTYKLKFNSFKVVAECKKY